MNHELSMSANQLVAALQKPASELSPSVMSYKSVKDVVTMLQENGFVLKSQRGSHMKFEKDGKVVIVPNHNSKGVEKGTYYSILRQAGLK